MEDDVTSQILSIDAAEQPFPKRNLPLGDGGQSAMLSPGHSDRDSLS